MKTVPLIPIASQQVNITLDGQPCQINVYQKYTGLYLDLFLNGAPVSTTVRCLNQATLISDRQYLGFVGDLMFWDTQGDTAPAFAGLGPEGTGRYQLIYLEASDLAALDLL
jgi:hypothetical protein